MPGCETGKLARFGFRVPAFEFQQHAPEQQVIRYVSNEGSFGNPADKHRRVASLRRQADPVSQFRVGLGRIHRRLCRRRKQPSTPPKRDCARKTPFAENGDVDSRLNHLTGSRLTVDLARTAPMSNFWT